MLYKMLPLTGWEDCPYVKDHAAIQEALAGSAHLLVMGFNMRDAWWVSPNERLKSVLIRNEELEQPSEPPFHVGICGAGIGGLLTAIAVARAGARVTVLEAAHNLGEIGAGIQQTPNVSRLLRKYGVDKVIGDNLYRVKELNLRRKDGTPIGHTDIARVEQAIGQPWWLVHRHHLHQGLVEVARQEGCRIHIASRVDRLEYSSAEKVTVQAESGTAYKFDLLIGADGVQSFVRKDLFPEVKPRPPTTNCAYRAIVPYEQITRDPIAATLVEKKNMEVWTGEGTYIIGYPISNGRDFNMVLSHHCKTFVSDVEDVDISEVRAQYADYDPRIKRIVDMIPGVQRWPLLVTGPLDSWSSPRKNVVLIGDAAHSMTNHMAQGAATAMEDGAFLGVMIREVVAGRMSLADAIEQYERERMPKAFHKQQVSFLSGAIWQLPEGEPQRARDRTMDREMKGEPFIRSANLYGDPATVLEVYGYDAEAHAERVLEQWRTNGKRRKDEGLGIEKPVAEQYINWFLPKKQKFIANL
ncbi:MAG: hypothetical protein M1820_003371 [Bogoriella megaspora]|nr:MAG: hypothetical protein M1820_003371 [Bogoriella megaspora]